MKKHIYLLVAMLVAVVFAAPFISSKHSSALSGSEFKAGRIIDDGVFYNSNAMSPSQIQAFLDSKVPNCDTNGSKQYYSTGMTRQQWASANGKPAPPYTCLKDYTEAVPSVIHSGSDLCKQSISSGTKKASQILYDVAKACEINPQVLIVLLQKEQTLITDDWPWPVQYQKATGYGCPDSAPCDSQYYGFFNQVYQAAKAFRRYEANPNSYNYKAQRNNYIGYHPNGSCGGSSVYIENQATASLYIYTPYQPNSAALNALYGTGDGCSSYGNRNFWRMFNDWFGSTQTATFNSSFVGISQPPAIFPGQTATVSFSHRNTGNFPWKTNESAGVGYHAVNLAATAPINRISAFSASSWVWPNAGRITSFKKVYESDGVTLASDQTTVWPGQIGKFEFPIKAHSQLQPGTYRETVQLVAEGAPNWIMGGWGYFEVVVK